MYLTPLFCRDLCYYLIGKRCYECYRTENPAMPLWTSIGTEIYCASRGGPRDSVVVVEFTATLWFYVCVLLLRAGRLKMREWKMRYDQKCKAGICRSGKVGTREQIAGLENAGVGLPYGKPNGDYSERQPWITYWKLLVDFWLNKVWFFSLQ